MSEKYNDILELKKQLIDECIPCEMEVAFDGYVLRGIYGDVAQHHYSNGLEAYKFDCCNGDIIPYLTVDEAFNLFKEEYLKYGKGRKHGI